MRRGQPFPCASRLRQEKRAARIGTARFMCCTRAQNALRSVSSVIGNGLSFASFLSRKKKRGRFFLEEKKQKTLRLRGLRRGQPFPCASRLRQEKRAARMETARFVCCTRVQNALRSVSSVIGNGLSFASFLSRKKRRGGEENRPLHFEVGGRAGEGQYVADVLHPRHIHDHALKPQAEARMLDAAVLAQVKVPAVLFHIEA